MRLAASEERSKSLEAFLLPRIPSTGWAANPHGEKENCGNAEGRLLMLLKGNLSERSHPALISLLASLRDSQAKLSKSCFIAHYNCSN